MLTSLSREYSNGHRFADGSEVHFFNSHNNAWQSDDFLDGGQGIITIKAKIIRLMAVPASIITMGHATTIFVTTNRPSYSAELSKPEGKHPDQTYVSLVSLGETYLLYRGFNAGQTIPMVVPPGHAFKVEEGRAILKGDVAGGEAAATGGDIFFNSEESSARVDFMILDALYLYEFNNSQLFMDPPEEPSGRRGTIRHY